MYWHHKEFQIAVFCDVIPHAAACGITSLKSNKDISNIYRTFTTMFTGCRLTETIYLTTDFLILKVGWQYISWNCSLGWFCCPYQR